MRGLFRDILALFTLSLSVIGCNQAGTKGSGEGPDDAPYHATFHVPGMT